jgi:3,4-dihydroxy 2-butanone 4-phosphate synthase / GTP cyclohydrolase II
VVEMNVNKKFSAATKLEAEANLPTRLGKFRVAAFCGKDGKEHAALVHGDLTCDVPLVRMHSECLTGDVFGSIKCDCRAQLEMAISRISAEKCGILLYLRQEGRGIGLVNKIRAYSLQDKGMDTVEANEALGFENDERDYSIAAEMLKAFGADRIRLLTNNPKKVEGLEKYGIKVVERIPLITKPTTENSSYLAIKKRKMGHKL